MEVRASRSAENESHRHDTGECCEILDIISDERSREILGALGDEMTPQEISNHCEIPLSTVYRKLQEMRETPLVNQSLRVEANGKGEPPRTFEASFDKVTVEFTGSSLELRVRSPR